MNPTDDTAGRGFEFPGHFEITALGLSDADLQRRVPELLRAAGVQVDAAEPRLRPSRQGNYVSVTVGFSAQSRADYDAAHEALRASADIKWTL